jgi:hypothetical protein
MPSPTPGREGGQARDRGRPPGAGPGRDGGQRRDKSRRRAQGDRREGEAEVEPAPTATSTPSPTTTPTPAPTPTAPATAGGPLGPAGGPSVRVPSLLLEQFRIPPFLLPLYQAAGVQYGVPWEVLAAINEIETDYGRNLNVSSAGAVGWMQFLPSSWAIYGTDANGDGTKDPYNPADAIFAAARYLRAAGADRDLRAAVFAYNHANWYVDSVLERARLIGSLPANLIGSLTGLTQARFPLAARATYAAGPQDGPRRGLTLTARRNAAAVAVADGRIVRLGRSKRLGRFVELQDAYGNTYTYGNLAKVARRYAAPKPRRVSAQEIRRELSLPAPDPAPSAPASDTERPAAEAKAPGRRKRAPERERVAAVDTGRPEARVAKERLFANPQRPHARDAGGDQQLYERTGRFDGEVVARPPGLGASDVVLRRLRRGAQVPAGTILGRIGAPRGKRAHLRFEIRPAGRGAPRIDPKPILDGWRLLAASAGADAHDRGLFGADTGRPSIGQILLMGKDALIQRVLADPRIEIYACGRRDIAAGLIDRRVLATLAFLAASGLSPTVSALECGHSYYTTSGNVSEHSSGNAVDIAAVNGIPIAGHQGPGSITEQTIRQLLTLQGTMRPHQIISLMTFPGADNTLSLPDHADHIHVGFQPMFGTNAKLAKQVRAILAPRQWTELVARLEAIENPRVRRTPSKDAIDVGGRAARSG